jgi:hypothetical protein
MLSENSARLSLEIVQLLVKKQPFAHQWIEDWKAEPIDLVEYTLTAKEILQLCDIEPF